MSLKIFDFRNLNKFFPLSLSSPLSLNCIREKLDPNNRQHYQTVQGFIDDCRLLFSNALNYYGVSFPESFSPSTFSKLLLLPLVQMDTKTYLQAQDLERFFEIQLRKLLPKYAKSPSQLARASQNQVMMPMSLHDLIDDMDDPRDDDYAPSNAAKRKRSTPSV